MAATQANSAINSLKSKITNLREELEKAQDKYEQKCKEVEEEKKRRNEVSLVIGICDFRLPLWRWNFFAKMWLANLVKILLHFCMYNIIELKLAAIRNSRINAMLL